MATRLKPVCDVPAYAVIIRATSQRGEAQRQALQELDRRGLWLNAAQKRQAGLTD